MWSGHSPVPAPQQKMRNIPPSRRVQPRDPSVLRGFPCCYIPRLIPRPTEYGHQTPVRILLGLWDRGPRMPSLVHPAKQVFDRRVFVPTCRPSQNSIARPTKARLLVAPARQTPTPSPAVPLQKSPRLSSRGKRSYLD